MYARTFVYTVLYTKIHLFPFCQFSITFTFEGACSISHCTGPLELDPKLRIKIIYLPWGGGGGGGLINIVTFISHPLSGVLHHRLISPLLKMYVYSVYIEISICSSWLLHTCTCSCIDLIRPQYQMNIYPILVQLHTSFILSIW